MTLKNKVNLSLVVSLVLSIFSVFFLIYPLYKDIKNSSQDLISQRQKTIFLENEIKNLKGFKKDYQEINPNLEKIEALFIKKEEPIDFVSFLEEISQDSQVPIEISPSLGKKIAGEPWSYLVFQINAASSFPDFLKFLEKLESNPFLIEIKDLKINRLTETELKLKEFEELSLGDIKVNFSIKAFAQQ